MAAQAKALVLVPHLRLRPERHQSQVIPGAILSRLRPSQRNPLRTLGSACSASQSNHRSR
uniref:Uncharacterized protein n=1 Tax=Siphoviridae sp. ct2u94 TaxID=2826277 RepID=A0A8S5QVF6_9CAUD|nr:MAG TPA: hypothetical protein [Siphoviridae sp. ct2u94]